MIARSGKSLAEGSALVPRPSVFGWFVVDCSVLFATWKRRETKVLGI